MRAAVETAGGVAIVDLEEEEVVEFDDDASLDPPEVSVGLPSWSLPIAAAP